MSLETKLSLNQRIDESLRRIKNGDASMRIPADPTDPDIVLCDCQSRIEKLEAELKEIDAMEERALPEKARAQMAYEAQVCRFFEMEAELKEALEVISQNHHRNGRECFCVWCERSRERT